MFLKFYRILRDATRLDIFDLAYEFGSESLNMLSLEEAALPRRGLVKRICIFFFHLFSSIPELWRGNHSGIPTGAFVFFTASMNEKESLLPVFARLPDAYWVGYQSNNTNSLPFFWAHMLSCLFFPLVAIRFLKSEGYKRKSFSYIFDHYWMAYGLYSVGRLWLHRLRPKALVLANDVNTYHRVVLRAARDEGISTFYLQHASVPENFPPLAFDYALLEGYDALLTHARLGDTQTKVFLIGMPRHDEYYKHINNQVVIGSIGICTNGLDPINRAEELCAALRREFPTLSITLRPHNSDLRVKDWKELSRKYAMEFSDSSTEISFNFLKRVDAIVAGESNIHLEAALMNVVPLYYDFGQTHLDWYRFQANGLVEYASEPAELCRVLQKDSRNRPQVRARAKPYCATIGTSYDGRSSEMASTLLQKFTLANGLSLNGWKRIPDLHIEAYELSCDHDVV